MNFPLPLRGNTGAVRQVALLAGLRALVAPVAVTVHQAAAVTAPPVKPSTTVASIPSQPQGSGSDQAAMNAFFSYSRPDTYKVHKSPAILVPMRDGYTLTCDLYQPARSDRSV